MHRDFWLRLLCDALLMALCACGRITHDIGQIKSDNQKSDGSIPNDPLIDGSEAGRLRDTGGEMAGADTTRVPERLDASYDGNRADVFINQDADGTRIVEASDSLDASAYAPDIECTEENIEIDIVPFGLDIYVMMDALLFTGFWSFPNLTPDQTLLWSEVRQEISAFVDDTDSEGIGVGIQYYGRIDLDDNAMIPTYCKVSTYEEPIISIAELPDNAEQIKASFPNNPFDNPFNTSPIVPALEGAVRHAKSRVQDHPERKQVVFLITGTAVLFDPFCESSVQSLYNAAEQGYSTSPSVATYVVGIYASDPDFFLMTTFLRGVAMQGGTSRPYLASLNREQPELAQKLGEARDAAKLSACGLSLPQKYQDSLRRAIDPDFASIVVTTNDSETIELHAVIDHSFCSPDDASWYFDDPANPSSIVACERTCEFLNSESISRAELRLRCPN